MSNQRIFLTPTQKKVLEKVNNLEIVQKVSSKNINHDKIKKILDISEQNAQLYIQRNYLGEKLNLYEENNLFKVLVVLKKILALEKIPRRIECYDISHISGKFVYGSMVVFIDGKPQKKFYRLFKTKEQNNDFENHKEVLRRRFARAIEYYEIKNEQKLKLQRSKDIEPNIEDLEDESRPSLTKKLDQAWEMPDLIIVDGGKGQLSSDLEVVTEFKEKFSQQNLSFDTEICALAKKEEEIFVPGSTVSYLLKGDAKFLIQRIRDEAHRFAIKNNRQARIRSIRSTDLSKISGIGAKSEQKILAQFGSVENLMTTLQQNSNLVYEILGKNLTQKLQKYLKT